MGSQRKPVSLLVVGAGDRGSTYAGYTRDRPDEGRVVAVVEPDEERRARFAREHGIEPASCFGDFRRALAQPRRADAVIIATPDREHAAPAIAFAEAGWDILLEKPMAPTPEECRAIVSAVKEAGVLFGVCHVLRYTPYTATLKRLIEDGAIGNVVCAQRLEPVGWWHFAHSYVRGNWRREEQSASVLLTKCCHDLDWLRYVLDAPCEQVASFAALHHFRHENAPSGAAQRCLDCSVEPDCAYSAVKLYLENLARGDCGWPVHVLTPTPTEGAVRAALREGPYGRCVYACDNDVPDHQVVILQFEGSRCASFTMSAFTPAAQRRTTIFGTHGWLVGDGERIEHHDFARDTTEAIEIEGASGRHGGGDEALMRAFLGAVAHRDSSRLLSGPDETLQTHLMVFAAEQARHENRVVRLQEWTESSPRRRRRRS